MSQEITFDDVFREVYDINENDKKPDAIRTSIYTKMKKNAGKYFELLKSGGYKKIVLTKKGAEKLKIDLKIGTDAKSKYSDETEFDEVVSNLRTLYGSRKKNKHDVDVMKTFFEITEKEEKESEPAAQAVAKPQAKHVDPTLKSMEKPPESAKGWFAGIAGATTGKKTVDISTPPASPTTAEPAREFADVNPIFENVPAFGAHLGPIKKEDKKPSPKPTPKETRAIMIKVVEKAKEGKLDAKKFAKVFRTYLQNLKKRGTEKDKEEYKTYAKLLQELYVVADGKKYSLYPSQKASEIDDDDDEYDMEEALWNAEIPDELLVERMTIRIMNMNNGELINEIRELNQIISEESLQFPKLDELEEQGLIDGKTKVELKEQIEHKLAENVVSPSHLKTGENQEPLPYKCPDIDLKLHLARFTIPSFRPGIQDVDTKYHAPSMKLMKKLRI